MRRRKRSISILCLVLVLLLCFSGCSKHPQFVLTQEQLNNQGQTDGQTDLTDPNEEPAEPETLAQMTEESIQELNNGNAMFAYSDEGYLTYLKGNYYPYKIETWQDASDSINCMAELLGITQGSDWMVTYGESDAATGYTFYVLQQVYDGVTVQYGTLRIAIDPEGYIAALSSSVVPNLGIAQPTEAITAEEAEQIVRNALKGNAAYAQYDLYSEYTVQSVYENRGTIVRVYCVYTSNPNVNVEVGFYYPYCEHLVTLSGEYLGSLAAMTATADRGTSIDRSAYFETLEPATWSGTVTWTDGSQHDVTIPVAYNRQDGLYYMADVERKIIMADYSNMVYKGNLVFTTSTDNAWYSYQIMQMYNYVRAYDFYAGYGIKSVDGLETPILILTDYADQKGQPVDNACYMGLVDGWQRFGASSISGYEQSLDILAHEFTHGVTATALCGTFYQNETGAINESYSDIMGELCEQINGVGESEWLLGQDAIVMRSMSHPNDKTQPEFVGDVFYLNEAANPDAADSGGVHINSSLLNVIAYNLHQYGMPVEEEAKLWLSTTNLLTPRNSYDEVYLALLSSIDMNGYDSKYKDFLKDQFEKNGLLGNRLSNSYNATKPGYCHVSVPVAENCKDRIGFVRACEIDFSTGIITDCGTQVLDINGNIDMLLPQNTDYYFMLITFDANGNNEQYFYKSDGAWSKTVNNIVKVNTGSGGSLPAINI